MANSEIQGNQILKIIAFMLKLESIMNQNEKEILPIDYLDQIAPKKHVDNSLLTKKPLIIGLILAVIIALGLIMFGGSGSSKNTSTLAARLKVTSAIAVDATKKIKSSKLDAINSDLKIYLANTIRDITPILAKDNIKMSELNKELVAAEAKPAVISDLEDARLNNIFDRTYSLKMYYQLKSISTLMTSLSKSTNSKSLKTFLDASETNLAPIQKSLADFYDTTN